MKDELGERMKRFYEDRYRYMLPRRTYTIIRIDGKAFHTYTHGLTRPFDAGLVEDMDETACFLCKNIQGAKCGFVQSDEISILLTDFDKVGTDAWFDGNIQKMASIAASLATAKFNELRYKRYAEVAGKEDHEYVDFSACKLAMFDARVFIIPLEDEVVNYFIWRQQDTVRNSISSVAQYWYPNHNDLMGKNTSDKQEMIYEKGDNWNDYAPKLKRGRFILKKRVELETPFVGVEFAQNSYVRNIWVSEECPTFTQDREFLLNYIRPTDESK